jgi:hypothetical protein
MSTIFLVFLCVALLRVIWAYTPIEGKFGRITVAAVNLLFNDWKFSCQADVIDNCTFEMTPDSNGIYHKDVLIGFCDSKATLSGKFDSGNSPLGAGLQMFPDGSKSTGIFLGYNPTVGLGVDGRFLGYNTGTQAKDAGMFDATLQVTTINTYPA